MTDVWVVETTVEDDDPIVYGPYTQRQAERVVEKIRAEVELATNEVGANFHPHGVTYATAYPISKYDRFMTTEERREARSEVRESNRGAADDG